MRNSKYHGNVLENFIKNAMENDEVIKIKLIKIKLRKYTYSFIKIPAPTDKIGGCFGCFFCNKKGDYYTQVCGNHSKIIGPCGSIFKKNHTILKLIKKECNAKN